MSSSNRSDDTDSDISSPAVYYLPEFNSFYECTSEDFVEPGKYSKDGSSLGSSMCDFESTSDSDHETDSNYDEEAGSNSEEERVLEENYNKVKNFLDTMTVDSDLGEEHDSKQYVREKFTINLANTIDEEEAKNDPEGVINDQFGLLGLLMNIKTEDKSPFSVVEEIAALGLNLDEPGYLYPTFEGPWGEDPREDNDE